MWNNSKRDTLKYLFEVIKLKEYLQPLESFQNNHCR